jgi:hypothetical protein
MDGDGLWIVKAEPIALKTRDALLRGKQRLRIEPATSSVSTLASV